MKKKSMQELARLSCEEYHKVEKLHIVVVLDDVRSLNNIGSIFRTADAFLIEKIYLCESLPLLQVQIFTKRRSVRRTLWNGNMLIML